MQALQEQKPVTKKSLFFETPLVINLRLESADPEVLFK
jgi:hypothetical protein